MVHLKSKTIRELNEKDLQDRLKQVRTDLFKLHIESKKVEPWKEGLFVAEIQNEKSIPLCQRSYKNILFP